MLGYKLFMCGNISQTCPLRRVNKPVNLLKSKVLYEKLLYYTCYSFIKCGTQQWQTHTCKFRDTPTIYKSQTDFYYRESVIKCLLLTLVYRHWQGCLLCSVSGRAGATTSNITCWGPGKSQIIDSGPGWLITCVPTINELRIKSTLYPLDELKKQKFLRGSNAPVTGIL